jgi:hypothetical protein
LLVSSGDVGENGKPINAFLIRYKRKAGSASIHFDAESAFYKFTPHLIPIIIQTCAKLRVYPSGKHAVFVNVITQV